MAKAGVEQVSVAVWSVIVAGLVAGLVWTYFRWRNHPLYGKNIPVVYPVFGSVIELLRNRDTILDWVTGLLRSSPTQTVRTVRPQGSVMFMTANPDNVEHILRKRFDNYPKGKFFRDVLEDLLGKGIFNADDELWRIQRKVASYEFTTRSLRELVFDSLETEIRKRMVPWLERAADEESVIDLQDMLMRLFFDSICLIAFGEDPACLELTSDAQQATAAAEFAHAFDEATARSSRRFLSVLPGMWKVKRALNIGSEKRLRAAVAVVKNFAMSVIQKRRKQLELDGSLQHPDLLSRFIRLVDSEDSPETEELKKTWSPTKEQASGKGATDEFLRDIAISFILAGRDTSSSSLSWFFWRLSRHPEVEKSIHSEIVSVVQARGVGGGPGQVLTYDGLKGMHYLTAALTESLRLHPAVPADSKVAKEDDVLPDGTFIPKGSRVGYHPYAMGRMETIWGPDCLDYKPSRWLVNGEFQPANPYKFPVFQAGPRICLGKDMAMLQMKFVAAACIRKFTFTVPSDYQPAYKLALTMPIRHGLPVRVRRRHHSAQEQ